MNGPTVELPVGQRNWTALETLAEVSRQIDMSEKQPGDTADGRLSEQPRSARLELQEQYTLDNPPVSYEQRVQRDKKRMYPASLSGSFADICSCELEAKPTTKFFPY